jgi:hypothetical protein
MPEREPANLGLLSQVLFLNYCTLQELHDEDTAKFNHQNRESSEP